jgi:hypothetical protein
MADDQVPADAGHALEAYPAEAYQAIPFPHMDGVYGWSDTKTDFLATAQRLQLSPAQAKGMVEYYSQHLRTASEIWHAQEQARQDWEASELRQAEDRFWDLRERPYDLTPQERTEFHRLSQRLGTQPERYARSGVTLHVGR